MTLTIRFVFAVSFLLSQVACSVIVEPSEKNVQLQDLWNQLDIKPKPFLTMPYQNSRVAIYEHRDNNPKSDEHLFHMNRYFYSPVPILDHSSIAVAKNSELRFRVELWSNRLEREVALYLKDVISKEIKLHQLQIVPFERLLVSGQSVKSWKKYELEKSVWFTLPGFDVKKKKLDPKSLADELILKFSTDSAYSSKERLMIRIDELITAINTYQRIKKKFSNQDVIYVTNEVIERLTAEAIDYIENEVLNRQQILMFESLLTKQLRSILAKNKVTSKEINFDLLYKKKKEKVEEARDHEIYDDYEEMLTADEISYYAINLQSLESNEKNRNPLDVVFSLAMMTLSLKANDTTLYTKDGSNSHEDMRDVTIELKKQFTDLERQLRYLMEKSKDDGVRNINAEVQKLRSEIVKIKAQTCPLNIGSQSYCEAVPFYGCYCFRVDKKRHHHEAAALCKENGMKLVSLDARIEKDQFVAIIEKERKLKELMFWTSGSRVHSSTKSLNNNNKEVTNNSTWGWVWTGSGKPITNWNWMPLEPEKRDGHDYVVINYPTRYYQTYPAYALLYTACETRFGWPISP